MKKRPNQLKGKVNSIHKFNKSLKHSSYLEDYQKIMIERLNLNHIGKFHRDNVERIVMDVIGRKKEAINTDIKGGILLTCNIEPELYILIQETIKKLTGNYSPMDEVIHSLLTYFCHVYSSKTPKNLLPFRHQYKDKSKSNLVKFNNVFKQYYKNTVRSFVN